jgi:hypothetical protein
MNKGAAVTNAAAWGNDARDDQLVAVLHGPLHNGSSKDFRLRQSGSLFTFGDLSVVALFTSMWPERGLGGSSPMQGTSDPVAGQLQVAALQWSV